MNRQIVTQTKNATPAQGAVLQRKCACGQHTGGGECEECKKKQTLRRKRTSAEPVGVPASVHESLRSPGQPLDTTTRSSMELRFGRDFSRVRVHTGGKAAESAKAVNSLAYTVGRDVVFGEGQYAPGTIEGKRLLAHELTHVAQQQYRENVQGSALRIGASDDAFEREADQAAGAIASDHQVGPLAGLGRPTVQRDLARPPRGAPAPLRVLTADEVQAAITFNQNRFLDPYSIRVLRDVMGLEPVPAEVNEEFVQAVVEWQSERRLTQDGKVGHLVTRSFYLELVAEGQFRDAILLIMDSYSLPGDLRLNDIRIGSGANCCGPGGGADAVTFGGPHCPPVGGPINICFCLRHIPRDIAGYDHFIRITGHELIHVPQCAAGTGDVNVDEFEAFFFEVCSRGRAPQLGAADRVDHANIALAHFAAIPVALQTPARTRMRDQLNNVVAARGVGPC